MFIFITYPTRQLIVRRNESTDPARATVEGTNASPKKGAPLFPPFKVVGLNGSFMPRPKNDIEQPGSAILIYVNKPVTEVCFEVCKQ